MALLACVVGKTVRAQVDPHFSQYYIQPMSMNPAFSAMMVRFGAWVRLASRYETMARGETEPTEQMLALSYSCERVAARSSSIV